MRSYMLEEGDGLAGAPVTLPGVRLATLRQSSANLVNSIVGAGMMALPMGFAVLGLLGGLLSFAFVYWVFDSSIHILVKVSCLKSKATYGDLVEAVMGPVGGILVRISLVLTCLGFLISYMVIFGDLLVGSAPSYDGLVTTWAGLSGSSDIPWFLHRPTVVGAVCVVCLFPTLCLRSLERLAAASFVKVLVTGVFALVTVVTTALAAGSGGLPGSRLWPDMEALRADPLAAAARIVAVVPVVLTAYSCHFNIHPVMHELENFTETRMSWVVRSALGGSSLIFCFIGIAGYLSFGADVEADVLQNYSASYLAPLYGDTLGYAMDVILKVGYFVLLVCTYPLLNWPFRENILELAGLHSNMMSTTRFAILAACLLFFVYIIAMSIPTLWTALSLMGSTSAVMIIFVFPGIIQYASAHERLDVPSDSNMRRVQLSLRRFGGIGLVILGVFVGAAGVYSTVHQPDCGLS